MTDSERSRLILTKAKLSDGAAILYGWHYSGCGPARFGWYRHSACGDNTFLGRTADEVLSFAGPCVDGVHRLPMDVEIAICEVTP